MVVKRCDALEIVNHPGRKKRKPNPFYQKNRLRPPTSIDVSESILFLLRKFCFWLPVEGLPSTDRLIEAKGLQQD